MTRDHFAAALQEQLRIRGHTFSRADLLAFVASCRPLIEDDPDVTGLGPAVRRGRPGGRQGVRERRPRLSLTGDRRGVGMST
jgi:hypothetical protein